MKLAYLRSGILSLISVAILVFLFTDAANAQTIDPRRGFNNGVAAQGTDMYTQAMSGLRLFTPHRDNCNSTTEVFVKIYNNSNNVDFGFCIDKDEHSAGVIEWEDARKECLDDGKRLPEPAEFKIACQIGTGLSNTTDDYEWVSNHATYSFGGATFSYQTLAAGSGNCKNFTDGNIGKSNSTSSTAAFRCVR